MLCGVSECDVWFGGGICGGHGKVWSVVVYSGAGFGVVCVAGYDVWLDMMLAMV